MLRSCPSRFGHVASSLRSIHSRLTHGDKGVARGRAVSAAPLDRKVLQRVPELPRVQAWFDQKSGFFTMKDNPQNATCWVCMRSNARHPFVFTCVLLFLGLPTLYLAHTI